MNITENIKKRMAAAGVNQSELARRTGLTWANAHDIFMGYQMPRIQTLGRIAKALDCEISELLK